MGFQPEKNEWTDSQTQALMTYRQAGLPIKAIAAEMGMTKGQVLGRIWKVEHPAQPKFRGSLWTDRQKEIARLGAFHSADGYPALEVEPYQIGPSLKSFSKVDRSTP